MAADNREPALVERAALGMLAMIPVAFGIAEYTMVSR